MFFVFESPVPQVRNDIGMKTLVHPDADWKNVNFEQPRYQALWPIPMLPDKGKFFMTTISEVLLESDAFDMRKSLTQLYFTLLHGLFHPAAAVADLMRVIPRKFAPAAAAFP